MQDQTTYPNRCQSGHPPPTIERPPGPDIEGVVCENQFSDFSGRFWKKPSQSFQSRQSCTPPQSSPFLSSGNSVHLGNVTYPDYFGEFSVFLGVVLAVAVVVVALVIGRVGGM